MRAEGAISEVGVVIADRAHEVLRRFATLSAKRGFPVDAVPEVVGAVDDWITPGLNVDSPERPFRGPVTVSPEISYLALELITKFREFERHNVATGNALFLGGGLVLVHPYDGADPSSFVSPGVSECHYPRLVPIELPRDVVAFGLTGLGSKRDRVRFFGQLLRVYCDAIRLTSEVNSISRRLLRSAGDLSRLVSFSLTEMGVDERSDTYDGSGHASDSANPSEDIGHDSSPPGDPVASDSAPAAGGTSRQEHSPAAGGLHTHESEEA